MQCSCRITEKKKKQVSKKSVKINTDECKLLHLGWGNSGAQYRLGSLWLGSSLAGRDLGVLVDNDLNGSQQRTAAAAKASCIWGCIHRGISSSDRDVIMPPSAVCSFGARKTRRMWTEERLSKGGPWR